MTQDVTLDPIQQLPALARYLAARHDLVDASAHWNKLHTDILAGRFDRNGMAGEIATQAAHEHAALLQRITRARQMLTTIYTDHVNRAYWLLDQTGQVLERFPWGRDGRAAATIAQLQLEHPQALALAQRAEHLHPQLNGRALRAAQLVANNAVQPTPGAGYTVHSQNGGGTYTVTPDQTCTCIDWRKGSAVSSSNRASGKQPGAPQIANQTVCKHILATRIYQFTNPPIYQSPKENPQCPNPRPKKT